MIHIFLSDKNYENDIYPLVKAFYPEETVKVHQAGEQIEEQSGEQSREQSGEQHGEQSKNSGMTKEQGLQAELHIDFEGNRVHASFLLDEAVIDKQFKDLDITESKPHYKNAVKRFLYEMLSGITGKELPWGILTGIRPTKLVYEMLAQGVGNSEIINRMKEEYYCSDAKIDMSIRIAGREMELLKEMDYQNGYSLYLGIPFCPTTCLYCSFTSYPIARYSAIAEDYLTALEKEISFCSGCFPDKKLTTVYFGGGTPTTLSAAQLDRLLGLIKEHFDFTYVREFCVEAGRPDSITKEKLTVLKKWGVNRISINPQSMQQKTLDLIGRRHTVEDVRKAFELARQTGHDNINMDIIIGLPGENPEDVADTLRQIEALNPESLTVHTLALKRAARLNTEKENYASLKACGVSEMLAETIQFAGEHDYHPYYLYRQKNMADNLENIGYSKYGKEGLYNILIMEEKQTILALGAGGMSKFVFHKENRIERVDNVKSITDYVGRIDEMILRKQTFLKEYGSRL